MNNEMRSINDLKSLDQIYDLIAKQPWTKAWKDNYSSYYFSVE